MYREMYGITRDMLLCSERGAMEEVAECIAKRTVLIEQLKYLAEEGGPHGPDEGESMVVLLWEMTEMDEAVRNNLEKGLKEETARIEEARNQMRMLKNVRDTASSSTPRFLDKKG